MVKINEFDTESDNMTLSIVFPDDFDSAKFEVQAEHIWTSTHDGACYHGFKFKELSAEKGALLAGYLAQLATRPKSAHVKHATA
jgi:hypothetical protein